MKKIIYFPELALAVRPEFINAPMTSETDTISSSSGFRLYSLSEKAITVQFGEVIHDDMLMKVTAFNTLLHKTPFPGMITTVPAYTTVTVFFNPLAVMRSLNMDGADCVARVSAWLKLLHEDSSPADQLPARETTIPVYYGGEAGPDLQSLAQLHGITPEEVIRLHSSATYKVYMMGFVPGFAYLGGLPEALFSPRRQVPRQRVAAGSVGIAGKQTGVYPIEIPGGWQIIGQTPLRLFDAGRSAPVLLSSGDLVRFQPMSLSDFNAYTPL